MFEEKCLGRADLTDVSDTTVSAYVFGPVTICRRRFTPIPCQTFASSP